MKNLGLIVIGLMISVATFAQGKYGATLEDSVTCIESLATYKTYIKAEPKLALEIWKKAYAVCPGSRKTLYTNGVKIYKHFIKEEQDATKKELLIDTMLTIFDQRIQYFGQEGFVLGQKGQKMLVYRPKQKEETFAILDKAVGLTGDKTGSGTIVATMFAIINLEKAGKKTPEEVVAMYAKLMNICAANKNHPKYAAKYAKAEEKLGNVTSKYLTCETLVPMAEKNFEANKENLDWLKKTSRILKKKKCYEAPVFAKVAEAYLKLEPSAAAAEGMGKLFASKKEYSKAIDFYKQAFEMSEDDEEKAEISMGIAKTYTYKHDYASAKSYAMKAARLDTDWGEPYILIGDLYAQSAKSCDDGELGKWAVYWAAVDKYKKAKAIDGSVSNVASKKIASISSHYPVTKDLFFFGAKVGDSYTVKCWINETTTIRTK